MDIFTLDLKIIHLHIFQSLHMFPNLLYPFPIQQNFLITTQPITQVGMFFKLLNVLIPQVEETLILINLCYQLLVQHLLVIMIKILT